MAAPKKKPEAVAETPAPVAEPEGGHPSGWDHNWRNPDAVFADDDQCIDARMARLRPR